MADETHYSRRGRYGPSFQVLEVGLNWSDVPPGAAAVTQAAQGFSVDVLQEGDDRRMLVDLSVDHEMSLRLVRSPWCASVVLSDSSDQPALHPSVVWEVGRRLKGRCPVATVGAHNLFVTFGVLDPGEETLAVVQSFAEATADAIGFQLASRTVRSRISLEDRPGADKVVVLAEPIRTTLGVSDRDF